MTTFRASVHIALTALLATACNEPLNVTNLDSPDIARVFSDPILIEQVIGSGFQVCHNSTISGFGGIQVQLLRLAFENSGGGGQNIIQGAIPRAPILNSPTGQFSAGNLLDFSGLSRLSRVVSFALAGIDRLRERGRTLGSPAQSARARAFGFFVVGCALGNLALVYDSAAIVSPDLPADSVPPLRSAQDVMMAALSMMDSAVVVAGSPDATNGSDGFPLPASWLGDNAMSRDEFVAFVRSWKARFRAGVSRTPAERAAANWSEIIADAGAGNARDVVVKAGGSTGWSGGYGQCLDPRSFADETPSFYIGMADVSRAYDAWLATPLQERSPFVIVTPDRRFPQGATRTQQQANSVLATNYLSLPLLFNRADNPSGNPWNSWYTATRYAYLGPSPFSCRFAIAGDFPIMMRAEMDLLMAEGHIRFNRVAEAAAKIDITRVARGQLPGLTGRVTNLDAPVPGAETCVPRVPALPNFTTTRCGNVLEALKWEKRLETLFVGYGAWFMDSRGWGDLVEGSPLEFPVPWQEMQARHRPYYNLGGGGPSSAARGTYGF